MSDLAIGPTRPAAVPAPRGLRRPRLSRPVLRRPHLGRRHLWLVPGFAIAVVGNQLGSEHGVGILALVAFGIGPDLPRLLRLLGSGPAAVAIRASNLLHQPLVALAALAIAAAGAANDLVPVTAVVAGLVWVSHIVIGWAVGDGIRSAEGLR